MTLALCNAFCWVVYLSTVASVITESSGTPLISLCLTSRHCIKVHCTTQQVPTWCYSTEHYNTLHFIVYTGITPLKGVILSDGWGNTAFHDSISDSISGCHQTVWIRISECDVMSRKTCQLTFVKPEFHMRTNCAIVHNTCSNSFNETQISVLFCCRFVFINSTFVQNNSYFKLFLKYRCMQWGAM